VAELLEMSAFNSDFRQWPKNVTFCITCICGITPTAAAAMAFRQSIGGHDPRSRSAGEGKGGPGCTGEDDLMM